MRVLRLLLLGLFVVPVAAQAAPITFSGYLDNPASLSPAGGQLVDYLLGAPDLTVFPDQNVALFTFTLASPSAVSLTSRGYGDVYGNTPNVDGFDAYLALFEGTGNSASFFGEFYNPIQPGDFTATSDVLPAGTHTLAISVWFNSACGDGGCFPSSGTLGDGFSGLSNPDLSRVLYFEVDLDTTSVTPPPTVPEPSTLVLLSAGAASYLFRRRLALRSARV